MFCQRAASASLCGAVKSWRSSSTKSGRLHTSTMSQPASNDRRARSRMPPTPHAPSMVKSSEKITPSKPSWPRNTVLSQYSEKPAGCLSIFGYTTWAGITAAMPCCANAAKGAMSLRCSSSKLRRSSGRTWWLSPSTNPCPGKCLPHDFMPPRFRPRCKASASSVTMSGRRWKLRLPMTAHCPQSKSSTGVNDKSTPQAANSAASTQPICSAARLAVSAPSSSHISPSTFMAGRRVKPSIKRWTRPPS